MAATILVTGYQGGGKSYYAVELMLAKARAGGYITTNLPLVEEEWKMLGLWDQIIRLPGKARDIVKKTKVAKVQPDGTTIEEDQFISEFIVAGAEGRENLVIVDEASLQFDIDEQMKSREANQPIFALSALCRHAGLDLIFIAQHSKNVDAKLRRMAARRVHCVKTQDIPLLGWLLVKLPWCGFFCRSYYRGEDREADGRTWHNLDLNIGKLYRTHGEASKVILLKRDGSPESGKVVNPVERNAKIKFALALLFILALTGVSLSGLWGVASRRTKVPTQSTEANSGEQATANAVSKSNNGKQATANAAPAKSAKVQPGATYAAVRTVRGAPVLYLDGGDVVDTRGDLFGSAVKQWAEMSGNYILLTESGQTFLFRPKSGEEKDARRAKNDSPLKLKPFADAFK